ncbi:MAG: Gfo/Idh/MocA family oxidoreductase [Anaerolineae bacterium]|nr:Gfo/Idh/MocA family oxidoreductase [Anaerolineae bacterium]
MINAAVVGYGYAGRAFHSYLISLAEGLNLYAISTRNPERQAAARAAYPGTKIVGSLDDLLADDHVDLVVFATPHDTHHDLTIQAMDAGKNVVTDKVMAMNAREAAGMIEASERNGVMLSVFQNRRWDWDYLTVKKVIQDGLLGKPYLFRAGIMNYGPPHGWRGSKARSGGILYDWPAHFIDQALQLVPDKVESVYCHVADRGHWDVDIGNYAKLLIHFANGVLYEIEISNLAAVPIPRWYVAGNLGALVKHGLDPQEGPMREGNIDAAQELPEHRAQVSTFVSGERKTLVIDSVRGTWKSYYQNISDVLNKGAELAVKPQEVYRVMQVYDAAMQSAETGQAVRLSTDAS